MKEWQATRNSGSKYQEQRRESDNLGHPMDSNGAVSFQLAQVQCGPDCVPASLIIYIDGSFIKHGIPVKPIYG
jgi:hypothetical protein